MRIRSVALAGAIILSTSFGPTMAAPKSDPPGGRYVTQKMIDAQSGISFSVPNVGRFTIREVQYVKAPDVACRVSIRSVAALIKEGAATGSMNLFGRKKVKVWLRYSHLAPEHYVCYGPGADCVVKVDVDDLNNAAVFDAPS